MREARSYGWLPRLSMTPEAASRSSDSGSSGRDAFPDRVHGPVADAPPVALTAARQLRIRTGFPDPCTYLYAPGYDWPRQATTNAFIRSSQTASRRSCASRRATAARRSRPRPGHAPRARPPRDGRPRRIERAARFACSSSWRCRAEKRGRRDCGEAALQCPGQADRQGRQCASVVVKGGDGARRGRDAAFPPSVAGCGGGRRHRRPSTERHRQRETDPPEAPQREGRHNGRDPIARPQPLDDRAR